MSIRSVYQEHCKLKLRTMFHYLSKTSSFLNFRHALDPQKTVVRKNPSEEANTAFVMTGFWLLKSQQKSKS